VLIVGHELGEPPKLPAAAHAGFRPRWQQRVPDPQFRVAQGERIGEAAIKGGQPNSAVSSLILEPVSAWNSAN